MVIIMTRSGCLWAILEKDVCGVVLGESTIVNVELVRIAYHPSEINGFSGPLIYVEFLLERALLLSSMHFWTPAEN